MRCKAPGCQNGKIHVQCDACHNAGKVTTSVLMFDDVTCNICGGTGRYIPDYSTSKILHCRACRGEGRHSYPHRTKRTVVCATCKGRTISCNRCKGTGQMPDPIKSSAPRQQQSSNQGQTRSSQQPNNRNQNRPKNNSRPNHNQSKGPKYGRFYNDKRFHNKEGYATYYKIGFDAAIKNISPNFYQGSEVGNAAYRDGYRAGRS